MWLDLRVIDLGATEQFFTYEIGRGEALTHIAEFVVHLALDVAGFVVMQQPRTRSPRFLRCVIGRKLPHLEFDQFEPR